ncbi:DgyrCDS10266 [Dimorphilus gyrociliatus]|uniref:3-phosphoinositide-dependent protein kinase 1 n=1 Tax=Dimorphilus gyrociliatus TaxID=2664684 RepID=A0A7I8VZP6_9ANNE|nr:DgyrCDS10266 [Dimorphilus gyrociliatus]
MQIDFVYFAMSFAERGEILSYLKRLGSFDEECTQFYSSELVVALEYMKSKKLVHRDLKPENILLSADKHIKISDFGSVKLLSDEDDGSSVAKERPAQPVKAGPALPDLIPSASKNEEITAIRRTRTTSFVGTAQYVSPEVLNHKKTSYSYELLIFHKISKLEYSFPEGFNETTKDLVQNLLVIDPTKRLGCSERGGLDELKRHPFFANTKWDELPKTKPPELLPYLPARDEASEPLWSEIDRGLDGSALMRLHLQTEKGMKPLIRKSSAIWLSDEDRRNKLAEQAKNNNYHKFVENNLILKQGFLEKRRGLFARKRMFLLTEGPRLFYVDPDNMKLKGEVPWSRDLKTEAKNFKVFFVHTPNRTYYLEDTKSNALKWCEKINEVCRHYYGENDDNAATTSK